MLRDVKMILTYENLLKISDFNLKANPTLSQLNSYSFLSFQDALHYLIQAHAWQGKTILLPAFYCAATLHDMQKQGLKIRLCKIDQQKFDIDSNDFRSILETEHIDIILIYNFFGKNSQLYSDPTWQRFITPDTIIISDFAHALVPNHNIEFLCKNHFYIDSTRKTTCRMFANLIMPTGQQVNSQFVVKHASFKLAIRVLFFLKSWSLRLAARLNSKTLADIGLWLYGLHDNKIGSKAQAYSGFAWDRFLYQRINFSKIKQHRKYLQVTYLQALDHLQKYVELFPLAENEAENSCFFYIRIRDVTAVSQVLSCLNKKGIWSEVLWDFDAIEELSPAERNWCQSIIVLPYTLRTQAKHIQTIAALLQQVFIK